MATDALTVYELWDLTRPTIPPRSRLYHLEPVGIGTPYVESLTGYVARLAEAHCVRTSTLVMRELLPLLGRPHLSKPVNNSLSAFWSKAARALNGTRTLAKDWTQALETLTLRNDLRFLTLLTWADVLTPRGLLRPTRAWCPVCYEEWREAGQVVYEPLLWALKVVATCPRHRRRLHLQCPHPGCQQPLRLLAPRSRPGYCSRCEGWLGVPPEVGPVGGEALKENELKWQIWVVEAVGELVADAPGLPSLPRKERIPEAISTYVAQVAEGKVSTLTRELRLSPSTVWDWKQGEKIPQLERLLQLCYHFGISPLRLLTDDAVVMDPTAMNSLMLSEPPRRPKVSPRPFDADRVRRTLEAVLASHEQPPPSMHEVARRLGYSNTSPLYKHFPELCRAISARYLAYRKVRSMQKRQRLCSEVREATFRIHAQGLYPSTRRIAPLLSVPRFIRDPEATAVRHEALRELGWEK